MRLHTERKTRDVLVAGVCREVGQREIRREPFACGALRPEVLGAFGELLDKRETTRRVGLVFDRRDGVGGEQVLVALVANLRLGRLDVEFAERRVRVFPRPAMTRAVRDIFRRVVNRRESLLADRLVRRAEPRGVERARLEFLRRKRRVMRDNRRRRFV